MELVQGNIEAFTGLFNSTDPGEISAQDNEDEEQYQPELKLLHEGIKERF